MSSLELRSGNQEIYDTMNQFSVALDTNDWDLYRSCLADILVVDYKDAIGIGATHTQADDWVHFVKECVESVQTHHVYTNFLVTQNVDKASLRLNHTSRHRNPNLTGDNTHTQYGWYEVDLELQGTWKIVALRHRIQWDEGNPNLVDSENEKFKNAYFKVFQK